MQTGAALYAALPGGNARLVRRLCVFIAASISLHALMLAYTPGGSGGGGAAREERAASALHAVLAPAPLHDPGQDERATAAHDAAATQAAAAVAQPVASQAARSGEGVDLPLPDKWYTASELGVLAEPLAPVKLAYPEEFADSTIVATVRIRLFVDERGTVQKIQLVEPGPYPAFDGAAIRQWEAVRFKPGLKDGIAVKSQKLLELEYLPF
jgi:TonB family protein